MYRIVGPACVPTVEQAQAPIRIPFAVAQIASHETIAARKAIGMERRHIQRHPDALLQGFADSFVGIDAKHPVVLGLRYCKLFLRPEAAPFGLHYLCAVALRQINRVIVAAGVDDNDFVAEGEGAQTRFDLARCVECDQDGRERLMGHGVAIIRAIPRFYRYMRVLLVKTSSLGDVVHNLPLVTDIQCRMPGTLIDWVVEEGFADIPRLHPGVSRVIPAALRRWRKRIFSGATWREIAAFRRDLRGEYYDIVLDSQGLIKSALIAKQALLSINGRRVGYAAEAAREPLAARFYDTGFAIPKNAHAIDRNRWLASAAFDYPVAQELDYGIGAESLQADWLPASPYTVLLTGTSRADKCWPESDWVALGCALETALVLPAGSAEERARAERLAQQFPRAVAAPALGISALAGLLAGSQRVIGLDTGLTHLAAALGKPTLAIFAGSDPELTGVLAGTAGRAVANIGCRGAPPNAQEVIAAVHALDQ